MARSSRVVSAAAMFAIAAACGEAAVGSGEQPFGGGSAGTGSDAGGSGGGGVGGGGGFAAAGSACASASDCAAGEACSVAGVCIPSGTCAVSGDCGAGTFCGATRVCLADGTCASDADCDQSGGFICDLAAAACAPGGGCGAEEFSIERVQPNLLIVLDRSCSMRRKIPVLSKWEVAVDAIVTLTTAHATDIRWGLNLFPDTTPPECEQAASAVPLGAGSAPTIQSLLGASLTLTDVNYPDGPCVTNIDTAVQQASQDTALADPTRKSFVLLLTDGKQAGCNLAGGDLGTEQLLGSMFSTGVATFVVGFGDEVDPAQMNRFADAGGMPRSDPTTRYYQADDAATLDAALATIASSVVSCDYALGGVPPDPSQLFVFFDAQKLPRDPSHQSGWDYDPTTNRVSFHGDACDRLEAGTVADVDVVFGCDEPTPS
ncbi:MAG: VWA domain-containing protein [Polyangiaceae bacterium]|nr:VWA domain-containing protein [Polyangiaceae bacterium]